MAGGVWAASAAGSQVVTCCGVMQQTIVTAAMHLSRGDTLAHLAALWRVDMPDGRRDDPAAVGKRAWSQICRILSSLLPLTGEPRKV